MGGNWNVEFEDVVLAGLPGAPPGLRLEPDLVLAAYGLDSVGTLGLIASLEAAFGLTLPEDELIPSNFKTPSDIWALLSRLGVRA